MLNQNSRHKISRRFMLGAGASALAFASLPVPAFAGLGSTVTKLAGKKPIEPHLGKFLCWHLHGSLSEELTQKVADPHVSDEDTALALRTTFCPNCNTQINASYPVMPSRGLEKAHA